MTDPPTFEDRPAQSGDTSAVHAICADDAAARHLGFDPCGAEAFGEVFEELMDGGGLRVALLGGELVGVYKVTRGARRMSHVASLSTVAVAPACRGTGLARAMIAGCIERLRAEGVRRVELTVSADNERGLAFWSSLGFEHEGLHRAYFTRAGEDGYFDEVSMGLLLGDRQ